MQQEQAKPSWGYLPGWRDAGRYLLACLGAGLAASLPGIAYVIHDAPAAFARDAWGYLLLVSVVALTYTLPTVIVGWSLILVAGWHRPLAYAGVGTLLGFILGCMGRWNLRSGSLYAVSGLLAALAFRAIYYGRWSRRGSAAAHAGAGTREG